MCNSDFDGYRREMDRVGGSERQTSHLLSVLQAEGGRKPRSLLRRGRHALLAVAVCAALTLSVLAVSPSLREQLAQVLGGYGSYTQEVAGVSCVENGIEIKVISAMADSSMVKIYAEARDLSGKNRLTERTTVLSTIKRDEKQEKANEGNSTTGGGRCVGYDADTGTALLEFSSWGAYSNDTKGAKLYLFELSTEGFGSERISGDNWVMDLELERLPEREIPLTDTVLSKQLITLYISPLGSSILASGGSIPSVLAVWLEDGTVLQPKIMGGGSFGRGDNRAITCWEFEDPVDPAQVAGFSLGYWYIPLDGDTSKAGHWLSKLPT